MSDRPAWASEHADEAYHERLAERVYRYMPIQASEPDEDDMWASEGQDEEGSIPPPSFETESATKPAA